MLKSMGPRVIALACLGASCISFDRIERVSARVSLDPIDSVVEGPDGTTGATGETGTTGETGPTGPTEPTATLLANGVACIAPADCDSGHCVDGVCCQSACDAQCMRCDTSTAPGQCVLISGFPSGGRAPCGNGSASCAGACNGLSPYCSYPTSSTNCGSDCSGVCDGAGGCSAASGANCPGNYACQASVCGTSCAGPSGCAPFFECNSGGQCQRIAEADCLDEADDNGDGLADCEDPTCSDRVECVPDPGGGDLGFLDPVACTDPEYPASLTLHQGPNGGTTCTGCYCTPPPTICDFSVRHYSDSECSAGSQFMGTGQLSTQNGLCAFTLSTSNCSVRPYSLKLYAATNPRLREACTKQANMFGTPVKPPKTWTTTATYCKAAHPTATCPAGNSCVARRIGTRCIRFPGQVECSGIYTQHGEWYGAFNDMRQCTACNQLNCNAVEKTCPTYYTLKPSAGEDSVCTVGGSPPPLQNTNGFAYPVKPSDCNNNPGAASTACHSDACYNHYCSMKQTGSSGWTGGSCTFDPSTITGSLEGTDTSTVCCTP